MLLTPETSLQEHDNLVICYCAAWCRTCDQYLPLFTELSEQFSQWAFVWVDIEEHPELLIDEDIEDFPTILIQDPQGVRFLGALLPHKEHLQQLLENIESLPILDAIPLNISN